MANAQAAAIPDPIARGGGIADYFDRQCKKVKVKDRPDSDCAGWSSVMPGAHPTSWRLMVICPGLAQQG
jgi:hypothetical protein